MKLKYFILLCAVTFGFSSSYGQQFELKITPVQIDDLGGLQSYAVGTFNGEWLLVGGRLDGLHRRQPFASFSPDGRNQDLIVVNPETKSVWRAPLASLPTTIKEQLSSTNMQFYQHEDKLICTGGYGYSPSIGDHITYPYITIIDIPLAIESIKNNSLNEEAFMQKQDELFRVTGGALNKIEDVYYLVGGHKFMGRYNPMGPDHGPGFEQEYTNQVRKFKINTNGQLNIDIVETINDEMHLHRRDYNLVPYIDDDERKLMVYSGVFKNSADLPWLYPVSISKDSHQAREDFSQYYNHYHCAYLPLYDREDEKMVTLFFGGIAQFYEDDGWLVQDNDVPFVNTIAEVSQDQNGTLVETIMPETMPGYLGAGSIFILDESAPLADQDIVDASLIGSDFSKLGYIYGGIRSTLPNIFWINTGDESVASNTIYEVSVRQKTAVSNSNLFGKENELQLYPNPAQNLLRMSVTLNKPSEIKVSITDSSGKQIGTRLIPENQTKVGKNLFVLDNLSIGYGAFYYTLNIGSKVLSRKVIWSE